MNKVIYNSYSSYLRKRFGSRLQKITLNGGFTCPNRDGTRGAGGCTYCNNESFSPAAHYKQLSITDQLERGIEFYKKRSKKPLKYIAYFQSYSNTYKPLKDLKRIYEQAICHPDVVALSIGTRPDCIDDEKLDYLEDLNKKIEVTIEYGAESFNDRVLEKINRCHSSNDFFNAIEKTAKRKIKTCAHLIFGLPGEDEKYWVKNAQTLSSCPISFVKLHQLHIVKGTKMAKDFQQNPFTLLSLDEYLSMTEEFLTYLRKDIVIQRLIGSVPKSYLAQPSFEVSTSEFIQQLKKKMEKHQSYQGKF